MRLRPAQKLDMDNLRPSLRMSQSSNFTRLLKRSFESSWFGASKGINFVEVGQELLCTLLVSN